MKSAVKKTAAKEVAIKKVAARKTADEAVPAKKAVAKKAPVTTPVAKKAAVKKAVAKKAEVKATPGKAGAAVAKKASGATKSAARKSAVPAKPERVKPTRTPDVAEQLRAVVLGALGDLKAKDVQEIDVRGKSNVTDLLVIASGTSSRHVKSVADEVVKKAKLVGIPPIGVEGEREGEWVLVDLGDIIVHVMLPRTREFYGLERLWTVGYDPIADVLTD